MKANGASEKLYFGEGDKGILDIYSNREFNDEIEYIRTDAFIEKAIKYVANHFLAPGMDNEIEDFVNYMKGE